jgi:hypothetical protein
MKPTKKYPRKRNPLKHFFTEPPEILGVHFCLPVDVCMSGDWLDWGLDIEVPLSVELRGTLSSGGGSR